MATILVILNYQIGQFRAVLSYAYVLSGGLGGWAPSPLATPLVLPENCLDR